jgi:hypothetical protein
MRSLLASGIGPSCALGLTLLLAGCNGCGGTSKDDGRVTDDTVSAEDSGGAADGRLESGPQGDAPLSDRGAADVPPADAPAPDQRRVDTRAPAPDVARTCKTWPDWSCSGNINGCSASCINTSGLKMAISCTISMSVKCTCTTGGTTRTCTSVKFKSGCTACQSAFTGGCCTP